jgi:aspartyl-tRNA(Asn)/glutamyl-tRNA(Gln) amidotransferase subunit B
MRLKEESEDYRYFPEPDLPPLRTDAAMIAAIRAAMPELPAARRARYSTDYGLSAYDASVIVASAGDYYAAAMATDPAPDPKIAAALLSKIGLREQKSQPDLLSRRPGADLAEVVRLRTSGAISSQSAEDVYLEHLQSGESVASIVATRGLRQISDVSAVTQIIDKVIAANPAAVADFHAGKEQALKFLTGQVMKESRGQANAAVVAQLLGERLRQ